MADRTSALGETISELESFTYSVAHDLRAPIRSFKGYTQMLLEDYVAAIPPEALVVVERIQRDVAAVAADPEIGAKLQGFGIVAVSSTPSEFDRYYRGEIERWSKVFKDSGITLE